MKITFEIEVAYTMEQQMQFAKDYPENVNTVKEMLQSDIEEGTLFDLLSMAHNVTVTDVKDS